VNLWSVDSAINAENGEANKVRNVVNGEIGAVPAVARFYKVIYGYNMINSDTCRHKCK